MILFTKEVFVQLKAVTAIYLQNSLNHYPPAPPIDVWSIQINGQTNVDNSDYDNFCIAIQTSSREEALRIYKELMQQVVDSGSISELQAKLFDDVLKEKAT